MNIACIRHLESLANLRPGFCYKNEEDRTKMDLPSDDNVGLSPNGFAHGDRIRVTLREEKIFDRKDVRIICSPYKRTKQTRGLIFPKVPEDQVVFDPRLCERNSGWCAGMTEEEVRRHFPWLADYWSRTHPLLAKPPGGESLLDVVYRIMPVVQEIKDGKYGKESTNILIGHGNLFKAVDFILRGLTFDEFGSIPNAPNGSLSFYRNVHLGSKGMTVDKYQEVIAA